MTPNESTLNALCYTTAGTETNAFCVDFNHMDELSTRFAVHSKLI